MREGCPSFSQQEVTLLVAYCPWWHPGKIWEKVSPDGNPGKGTGTERKGSE